MSMQPISYYQMKNIQQKQQQSKWWTTKISQVFKTTRSSQDFIFCHNPSNLSSVIMLASHQRILDAFFKDMIDPYYFWIYEHAQQAENVIKQLSEEIRGKSLIFSNIDMMSKVLNEKGSQKNYQKIILIGGLQLKNQILMLLRRDKFIGAIVYYPITNQQQQSQVNDSEDEKYLHKFRECSTIEQLSMILDYNKWGASETKQFCNFVLLKQQVQKSTKLFRTMVAMLKQQIGIAIKGQILDQLAKVIQKLAKFHPKLKSRYRLVEQALSKLKKGQMTPLQVLKLYTSEKSKVYLILNSFLRAMNCPTQIYYIWPLFKPLFEAVQYLHQQNLQRQFVCYRGSYILSQEFNKLYEAVGEVVQNLGFLSTSLSKSSAESFIKNIIYEVRVNNFEKSSINVPGFASISKFSDYFTEQEILFNPLNYFHILEVKTTILKKNGEEDKKLYEILLGFGSKRNVELKDHQQLQNQQTTEMLLHLRVQIDQKIKCYKDAVFQVESSYQLQIALVYFQFLTNKANHQSTKLRQLFGSNSSDKNWSRNTDSEQLQKKQVSREDEIFYLLTVRDMSCVLSFFGKYFEALQLIKQCSRAKSNILDSTHSEYHSSLNIIGVCFYNLRKYQLALQFYKKYDDFKNEIISQKGIKVYLRNYNNIGSALQKLERYEEALKVHQKCAKYRKENQGQRHPDYLVSLNNIASVYNSLKWYQKALKLHYICEKIRREVLGERHLHYLISLNNIGQSLQNVGRLGEALQLLQRCASLRREVLGETNIDYLISVDNIGKILYKLGRFGQALKFHEECINAIYQHKERNKYFSTFAVNYAVILISHDREAEALNTLKLAIQEIRFRRQGQYFYFCIGQMLSFGKFAGLLPLFAILSPIFKANNIIYIVRQFAINFIKMRGFNQVSILFDWYSRYISNQLKKMAPVQRFANRKQAQALIKWGKKIKLMRIQHRKKINCAKTLIDLKECE